MKALNKKATAIMDKLIAGLINPGDAKKIDNTHGAFMALSVENIGTTDRGPLFSLAHYWKQNGDLMRDPEMVFLKSGNGAYVPVSFQQDGTLAYYQEALKIEYDKVVGYYPPALAEQVSFANMWMRNIKVQQHLDV